MYDGATAISAAEAVDLEEGLHDQAGFGSGSGAPGVVAPLRLPCCSRVRSRLTAKAIPRTMSPRASAIAICPRRVSRSEEHTSELQSRGHLVCRLLLEKKKHEISSQQPAIAAGTNDFGAPGFYARYGLLHQHHHQISADNECRADRLVDEWHCVDLLSL